MERFDVAVIGAGPAGYVAAIRCAQLGLRVACVDDYVGKTGAYSLGGTCLNVGCIPSKALLDSSDHYDKIQNTLADHGIQVKGVQLNVPTMIKRKDEIVQSLTQGIQGLFRKNRVTWIKGHGEFIDSRTLHIVDTIGERDHTDIQADTIILATGSSPRYLPNVQIDHHFICDSADALNFTEYPKRLGIIGAGVIGVELGSVWKRVGSEVVLLEALDEFLYFVDEEISDLAQKEFTSQGLDIRLGTRVLSAEIKKKEVLVRYRDDDSEQTVVVDKLIVAVGRKPRTDGLQLNNAGVLVDERGFIHVDAQCRTNIPTIFAIGDVVRGPMLAHKGSEEGIMVAERIKGQDSLVNYDSIPWIIYTEPEIAWVGKTEKELRAAARAYTIGTFPLSANGRARAMNTTTGLVKVIADSETDEVLGVHIFAPTASEMIAEAVVAMEFSASAEDIARIVHAHPTLSEAIHEAALAVDKRTLHM